MNTHEEIEYSKDLAKAKSCIQRNDTKEAEFILNKRTTNYRDSYKSTKNSSNSSCCTGCAEACNCCLSPIVCLGECFSCCSGCA